jgi:hypothetical protein
MPTPVRTLFAVEVGLAVMHLINPPVPLWAERGGATRYLWDLDAEANVPTWFASAQLAVLGALLLLLAMAIRRDRRRESIALAAAGVLAAALSLDELVGVHEKLGRGLEELTGERGSTVFDTTGPWVVVAAPLFVLLMVACWYALRGLFRVSPRAARLCLGGSALFLVSFAGLEFVANFLPGGDDATVLLEETGEMAGVTLILWGVAELAGSLGLSLGVSETNASAKARKPD